MPVEPLNVTKLIDREGWDCAKCGHRHAGQTLANICVGCPCSETTPPETAEDDWIRIASQNATDAAARLDAAVTDGKLRAVWTMKHLLRDYQHAAENDLEWFWVDQVEDRIKALEALDGPASGAPAAVDERSTERATTESTGTLIRYGVLHRTKGELYSHAPMADGYWTPWHLAEAAFADLEARVRFYEQHTDKQANELVEVTLQRDKWLAAFNRSEQFQNGPTLQRDRLRAALVGLVGVDTRAELEQLEAAMRLMPAPAQDKAATIDAIHALLATCAE
jgi:hypothetical protein